LTERATVFQTTQIGVESTAGTAVAALKKLQATSIEPAIKPNVKTFRPHGQKFVTIASLGKEWAEAKISGQGAYNDLTWLLAALMCTPTPAQQGGTTAYKSTYTMNNNAPDTLSTLTVQQGYSGPGGRAHRFTYGVVNELGIEITRDEVMINGSMFGQIGRASCRERV